MIFRISLLALPVIIIFAGFAFAAIEIDFSDCPSGPLIDAVNADFAQAFAGQNVVGNGLVGSPTAPLTLAPSGDITVEFFPVGGWGLLPQPNNQAPLCFLLDFTSRGAISWVMGHASPPSTVDLVFFDEDGNVVLQFQQILSAGYSQYNFDIPVEFRGVAIHHNTDASGLRFYDFWYTESDPVATETITWDGVKTLFR